MRYVPERCTKVRCALRRPPFGIKFLRFLPTRVASLGRARVTRRCLNWTHFGTGCVRWPTERAIDIETPVTELTGVAFLALPISEQVLRSGS
jgi:hypothetical protein